MHAGLDMYSIVSPHQETRFHAYRPTKKKKKLFRFKSIPKHALLFSYVKLYSTAINKCSTSKCNRK